MQAPPVLPSLLSIRVGGTIHFVVDDFAESYYLEPTHPRLHADVPPARLSSSSEIFQASPRCPASLEHNAQPRRCPREALPTRGKPAKLMSPEADSLTSGPRTRTTEVLQSTPALCPMIPVRAGISIRTHRSHRYALDRATDIPQVLSFRMSFEYLHGYSFRKNYIHRHL